MCQKNIINEFLLKFLEAKYEYYEYVDANNQSESTLIYNVTSLRWDYLSPAFEILTLQSWNWRKFKFLVNMHSAVHLSQSWERI